MNLIDKPSNFLIIPDMHIWDKNISSRKDYVQECVDNFNNLISIVGQIKSNIDSEKLYLVFLGDVFHNGFKNLSSLNYWIQQFTILRSMCNSIFCVVGNHEMHYVKNNPLWSLTNGISSSYINAKGFKADGVLPIIQIPDEINIFNYSLQFNHFERNIAVPDSSKTNILFSHNSWMNNTLFKSLESLGNTQISNRYMNYNEITEDCALKYFNCAFFGHNHLLLGDYEFEWEHILKERATTVYFCGSIGLTNRNEVSATKRYRVLPLLHLDASGIPVVKKYTLNLSGESDSVLDLEAIDDSMKNYEASKFRKALIKKYNLTNLDPIQAIIDDLANDVEKIEMFNLLEQGGVPLWLEQMM